MREYVNSLDTIQAQASFFAGVEYKKGDKIAPFITQTLIKLDMMMYWKILNDKTPLNKEEFFDAHNGEWKVDTRLSKQEDRTLRVDPNVRMQLNRNRDFTRRRIDMWNGLTAKMKKGSEYTMKKFLKKEYAVTKTEFFDPTLHRQVYNFYSDWRYKQWVETHQNAL